MLTDSISAACNAFLDGIVIPFRLICLRVLCFIGACGVLVLNICVICMGGMLVCAIVGQMLLFSVAVSIMLLVCCLIYIGSVGMWFISGVCWFVCLFLVTCCHLC